MTYFKRSSALFLALILCLSLLCAAWASEDPDVPEDTELLLAEELEQADADAEPAEEETPPAAEDEAPIPEELEEPAEDAALLPEEENVPTEDEPAEDESLPSLDGALASGTCGDTLTWELSDDGTLTISGSGDMWDFDWENSPEWSEYFSTIKSVIIQDGVTGIGKHAQLSSVTSVSIPLSVKRIGDSAFGNYYGYEVIPDVSYAGTEAQWQTIEIGKNNGRLWEGTGYALHMSGKLDNGFTWTMDGDTLTISGNGEMPEVSPNNDYWDNYFYPHATVRKLVFEEGITVIAGHYGYEVLESVSLPQSLQRVGNYAFNYCSSLKTVSYPGSDADWAAIDFGEYNLPLIQAAGRPVSVSDKEGGFSWSLDLSGTLTISGEGAMLVRPWSDYSFAVKSIKVGEGVTSIGAYAFRGCPDLESVELPASVTAISEYAFDRTFDTAKIRYAGSDAALEELLSGEDAQVGIAEYNISPAVVGQPYAVQFLAIDPKGHSVAVSVSCSYTDADGKWVEADSLPAGLSMNADGSITGTPTEAINYVYFSVTVSWDTGTTTYSGLTLQILTAEAMADLIKTPDTETIKLSFREVVTIPEGTEVWYRFTSVGSGTGVNQYNGSFGAGITGGVYDEQWRPVQRYGSGENLDWKGDECWSTYFATTPGKTYYLCVKADGKDCTISLGESIQVEVNQDTEYGSRGDTLTLQTAGITKAFEGSDNTLWDLYLYESISDSDLGILSWGWAWHNNEINIVTPYPVEFDGSFFVSEYGVVTDTEIFVNDTSHSAFSTQPSAGEGETLYKYIRRDAISCPGTPAKGALHTFIWVYVPAGKTLVYADGAYRDSETATVIAGDADNDGKLTPSDIMLILSGAANVDINNDGKSDAYDAALLLRYTVGLK